MATTYGVTEAGFVSKPLSVILDSLNKRFKAAFGANFVVDPESPDGQVIGIVADEIKTCWEQAENGYNAYRPGATEGEGLDAISELTHIERFVNVNSKATAVLGGSNGVLIPAGTVVGDGTYEFETQNEITLPGDVTVVCTTPGEIFIAPNTITEIGTEISGWTSVTNPEEGITGIVRESDPALRARRDRSTVNGSATVEAIYSGLSSLNLQYIRIRDNDTLDPIEGQPAGSLFVVVDGGAKNEIAQVIYSKKSGGIATHGTESVVVRDRKGYPHTIKFSRSTKTEIYVTGTFRRRPGANLSSVDVQQALTKAAVEYINGLLPGEPVIWSFMFGPLVNSTPGVQIDTLFFGLAPNPTTTDTITLDIDKRANALAVNVKFTETP